LIAAKIADTFNRVEKGFRISDCGFRIEEGMEHGEIQLTVSSCRNQRSGVKLISDLRLLTSAINDFYGFNDLTFTAP
jgi:hypothetical protein